MKLILLALALVSTSAFAWPSQSLSCSGEEGTWEGKPIYMKLDFQMLSPTRASGTMSDSEAANGPWTQGCTTQSSLQITPVNGLFEVAGSYVCVDNSGGQAVMMFDANAMTLSTNQNGSTTTYACQWQ